MNKRNQLDIGQGIFDMSVIFSLQTKSLFEAKKMLFDHIEVSKARDNNKRKAVELVKKSRSVQSLMVDCANFSLAFQGYKVL